MPKTDRLRKAPGRLSIAAAILAALIMHPVAPAAAQALLSEDAARAALERDYGIQVLRISADEQDGLPVFLVRVMNPGGDFNEAFQVNTLVVDRRTGKLVPQFRHQPSGVREAGGTRNDASENSGPVLRQGSARQ